MATENNNENLKPFDWLALFRIWVEIAMYCIAFYIVLYVFRAHSESN